MYKPKFWILDENHKPITVSSIMEWGMWFEAERGKNRIVKQTELEGDILVSTVFLGIDHGFNFGDEDDNVPILFETMIFGGELNDFQERYPTWEGAVIGHDAAVRRAILEKVKVNNN